MAGRYERVGLDDAGVCGCAANVDVQVNEHDEDDESRESRLQRPVPNSPPPSFHSRASSPARNGRVDPDLADAFDADGDSDDDEADDTQRLVRQSTTPSSGSVSNGVVGATGHQPPVQPSNTASSGSRPRFMGGGVGTDGVFANMSARPERTESEKDEQPPTYEQAAADAAPPYWETTILAPGFGGFDEVYVDGMPVGSVFSFIWNGMISTSFQLVGFLLTYLLHSTHAAKNGSRAGLGITLIQYGFYMKGTSENEPPQMNGPDGYAAPPDPNSHDFDAGDVTEGGGGGSGVITGGEWMAYVLMVVGWFILIKSVAEFLKARRHEQLVMQSPDRGLNAPIIAEGESPERVVPYELQGYFTYKAKLASPKKLLLRPLILVSQLSRTAASQKPVVAVAAAAAAGHEHHHHHVHDVHYRPLSHALQSLDMAWRCSGGTNAALVDNLWRHGLIADPTVKEAFLRVDRAHYSPTLPYDDSPQAIGHAATISAPHMHASAVEHVLPYLLPSAENPAPRALDVGSGSGYLTHVMAELVGDRGMVVGLEHIKPLRDLGESNMGKSPEGRAMLQSGRARFRVGDGRLGLREDARQGEEAGGTGWDVIHVGASAREVHPQLLSQLKSPGCMFIPVDDDEGGYSQHVWRITKDKDGNVIKDRLFGVRYVPLTDAPRA
ncbi:metal homeostatis protein bsd2 [Purpureocillium lavendulum]|uniref:Metal homeostatis protein bsd2 n=1 Tax=Purpureocillium lavendulum TaxID=1247861 RepID=A0AB34FXE6_9HYPO|nr:metal homeostatis protein bsd2 [Purpureocillium lavendulum]